MHMMQVLSLDGSNCSGIPQGKTSEGVERYLCKRQVEPRMACSLLGGIASVPRGCVARLCGGGLAVDNTLGNGAPLLGSVACPLHASVSDHLLFHPAHRSVHLKVLLLQSIIPSLKPCPAYAWPSWAVGLWQHCRRKSVFQTSLKAHRTASTLSAQYSCANCYARTSLHNYP